MDVAFAIELFSALLVCSFAGFQWGVFEKSADIFLDEAMKS